MAEPARAPPPPLSPNQRRGSAFPRRSSTLENLEKANERIKSLAGNGAGLGLAPDPCVGGRRRTASLCDLSEREVEEPPMRAVSTQKSLLPQPEPPAPAGGSPTAQHRWSWMHRVMPLAGLRVSAQSSVTVAADLQTATSSAVYSSESVSCSWIAPAASSIILSVPLRKCASTPRPPSLVVEGW